MKTYKSLIRFVAATAVVATIAGCGPASEEGQGAEPVAETGGKPAEGAVVAYGRFVPEREDDFTWENDKVAFRVYGPNSSGQGQVSGVDAWLKKVPYTIIDKWYAGHLEGVSYHEDHGEGYDPYHVGDSRGVGGTALWIDGKPWPAGKFQSYEVSQSGGDSVEFVLHYEWETPKGMVAEAKTVTLELGQQLYTVHSVFTLDGAPAVLPIVIGLTTHDGKADIFAHPEAGWISTWETIDELGVGTAVLVEADRLSQVIHSPSDDKDASHIWLLSPTKSDGTLEFKAGFAWEGAGEITSPDQWNSHLDGLAGK